MVSNRQTTQGRHPCLTYWGFSSWLALGVLIASAAPVFADGPGEAQPNFLLQILHNIFTFDSDGLMNTLGQREFTVAAFIAMVVIVFVETGLLVGFFLPGDSLLVTAGLVASNPLCGWNLPLLLACLSLAAVLGDTVGYTIGYKTGPRIFCREQSLFFHKDHLLKAQRFYEKHGGKTVVLARFMPILRTFAPVVAGVGAMNYRQFLLFNIFGGVGWVCSMILCGYYLPAVLNPILRPIFGEAFAVERHVEKVVIVVVLLSISPGLVMWVKNKLSRPKDGAGPKDGSAGEEEDKMANMSS
jgi:membrane-associated protein